MGLFSKSAPRETKKQARTRTAAEKDRREREADEKDFRRRMREKPFDEARYAHERGWW